MRLGFNGGGDQPVVVGVVGVVVESLFVADSKALARSFMTAPPPW